MFILLILGVGAVVFFLWRDRAGSSSARRFVPGNDRNSPLDILERRFTNGEIEEQRYEEMRKNLLER